MDYERYRNKLSMGHPDYDLDMREAWAKEADRLKLEFKRDVIIEVGLQDHPLADRAFDKAWKQCISTDHRAVHNEMTLLAEMLKV